MTGKLVFWSPKGFGFIRDDSSEAEIYINANRCRGFILQIGDRVSFSIHEYSDGQQCATNIKILDEE